MHNRLFFLFLTIFLFLTLNETTQAQLEKLSFQSSFSVIKGDKRLFDVPDERLYLELNENKDLHTSVYSFGLLYDIYNNERLGVESGIQWKSSKSRFTRPFDQAYKNDGEIQLILLSTDDFRQNFLSIPIRLKYSFTDFLSIVSQVDINFRLKARALNTNRIETDFSWTEFRLNAISIHGGFQLSKGRFFVSPSVRLLNYAYFDPIIFNSIIGVQNNTNQYELNNLISLEIRFGLYIL
jgi:hypothetical protein